MPTKYVLRDKDGGRLNTVWFSDGHEPSARPSAYKNSALIAIQKLKDGWEQNAMHMVNLPLKIHEE